MSSCNFSVFPCHSSENKLMKLQDKIFRKRYFFSVSLHSLLRFANSISLPFTQAALPRTRPSSLLKMRCKSPPAIWAPNGLPRWEFFFNKKRESSQIQTNREATLDDRRFGVFLTYSLFYLQPTDYVYQVGKLKFGIVVLFALFFPTLFWKEW